MKFLIDLPRLPVECGKCPCSERWGDTLACNLEGHGSVVLRAYMPTNFSPFGYVIHPRPEWCPLTEVHDASVKPYVNHGDHGPEPRFDGDAWTAWYCCGKCDRPINYGDNYCSSCGAKIDWSDSGRS